MSQHKKICYAFLSHLHAKLAKRLAQKSTLTAMPSEGERATVFSKNGTTFISSSGGLTIDFPQAIESVGIKNLTEVTEHHITTIVGSRSHLVRFNNGGELHFAYNGLGQLIELSARDLTVTVSMGKVVSFAIPHAGLHDKAVSQ